MTKEEAKVIFKKNAVPVFPLQIEYQDWLTAMDIVSEALDKQIPKKPNYVSELDDNGNVIKQIIHNFKTIAQEESTYEEEVPNNIIEANEYGLVSRITSGIDSYTFEYTYDRYAGNWISMTIYKNSIPVSIIEREITY